MWSTDWLLNLIFLLIAEYEADAHECHRLHAIGPRRGTFD